MNYYEISVSIAEAFAKVKAPMSDDQRMLLAGAIAPWLQQRDNRIAELERQLAFASDAAAKGEMARTEAAGMCERIQELEKLAAKWSDEIAVVYNEYSGGQRAGLTQAAAELRSLMESATK